MAVPPATINLVKRVTCFLRAHCFERIERLRQHACQVCAKLRFALCPALQFDDQAEPRAEYVGIQIRSEEHTSELQSLMRISYAVFCLKKQIHTQKSNNTTHNTHTQRHT